jgi:hypothetical protein
LLRLTIWSLRCSLRDELLPLATMASIRLVVGG